MQTFYKKTFGHFAKNHYLFSSLKPFLSQSQLQFYNDNGYLHMKNLVSKEDINEIISETHSLMDTNPKFFENRSVFKTKSDRGDDFLSSGDKIHFFFEPGAFNEKGELQYPKRHSLNKIGHAMHDLNLIFKKFSYKEMFKRIINDLGYKAPSLVQTMLIFKNPFIGQRVDPHSDNTYLITNPLSTVGIWVALDDADKTNGCLWGMPGTHKIPTTYFMKRDPVNIGKTMYDEIGGDNPKKYETEGAVPLEAKKGDVVLLHGDFVHFSKDNPSEKSRYAYTMHFVEMNPPYKWKHDNWMQRNNDLKFKNYYTEQDV